MEDSSENKNLVKQRYRALNEHNLDEVLQFYADDYTTTLIHPSGEEETIGTEQVKSHLAEFITGFPDIEFKIKTMVSEDYRVLIHYRATGTHEGEFLSIESTGNNVSMQGYASYRFGDGKIVETDGHISLFHGLRQMGIEFPIEDVEGPGDSPEFLGTSN